MSLFSSPQFVFDPHFNNYHSFVNGIRRQTTGLVSNCTSKDRWLTSLSQVFYFFVTGPLLAYLRKKICKWTSSWTKSMLLLLTRQETMNSSHNLFGTNQISIVWVREPYKRIFIFCLLYLDLDLYPIWVNLASLSRTFLLWMVSTTFSIYIPSMINLPLV